jgi:hypothetical protein
MSVVMEVVAMEGMSLRQSSQRQTGRVLGGRSLATHRLSARAPAPSLSRRGTRRVVRVAASVRAPHRRAAPLPEMARLDRAAGTRDAPIPPLVCTNPQHR